MPTDLDPRLTALVGEIMAKLPEGSQAPPPGEPGEGQSRTSWLAEVTARRDAQDDLAALLSVHLAPAGPDVETVRQLTIPVAGGHIAARCYTPSGTGPFPGLVFFHGGAWWLAGGEKGFALTDSYCRIFCAGLGAVIVNVDYRLAPEFPFPQQLEDSFAGLCWTIEHASTLNIDPLDVSVMGASSGGNQAAAVCLLARERGGPHIASQVLHAPALDLTGSSPSLHDDMGTWDQLQPVVALYASRDECRNPLVSPLLAENLSGLPPAVIVIGDYDPLRDDGARYAKRLQEHGVAARLLEFPMLHNIALPETSVRMFAEMIEAIRDVKGP